MDRPEWREHSTRVRVALVRRDYRESVDFDEHPTDVIDLIVASDAPLGAAVHSALGKAGQPILGDTTSLVIMLADVSDGSLVLDADLHRIDASVLGGRVHWSDEEWASNLSTLNGVRRARAEGLYPERFEDLVAFPVVDGGWGEAGSAGIPEIGLWLAEHGVGVASWIGQTLVENLVPIGLGYAFGRGDRARRMRRAVARWREANINRPHTLRAIVDRRAEWDTGRLAQLLGIERMEAQQLLRALGYGENRDGLWRRVNSRKARARRARWIADEVDV